MALNKEDHWIAIVGLGGLAFGYWYWKNHSGATTPAPSTDNTSEGTSGSPQVYIPGYDLAADNVVSPSQVYYQGTQLSGTTGPTGQAVGSSGQAITLPANT